MLEKAGNLRNPELAATGAREGYSGPVFMDSDLYKAIEAAAYSLATVCDPALEARLDAIIAKVADAQMPDGYLNTWYQVNEPDRRYTNLRDNHELYCAGHLFEAAVAHFEATNKRNLLDVATRFAGHLDAIDPSLPLGMTMTAGSAMVHVYARYPPRPTQNHCRTSSRYHATAIAMPAAPRRIDRAAGLRPARHLRRERDPGPQRPQPARADAPRLRHPALSRPLWPRSAHEAGTSLRCSASCSRPSSGEAASSS